MDNIDNYLDNEGLFRLNLDILKKVRDEAQVSATARQRKLTGIIRKELNTGNLKWVTSCFKELRRASLRVKEEKCPQVGKDIIRSQNAREWSIPFDDFRRRTNANNMNALHLKKYYI